MEDLWVHLDVEEPEKRERATIPSQPMVEALVRAWQSILDKSPAGPCK